jgi:hypothetical protein
MAKAYVVGNPRGKKKKKKRAPSAKPKANRRRRRPSVRPKARRRKPNPLEAVITGAGLNPHRKRKNKMAAKRKHHAKARSRNPRRRHLFGNKRRRHNTRRNPLLPVQASRIPALLIGGAAGGVGSVWIPNLLLASSDVGIFGYLLNAITAVLGAWALSALKMPDVALGWLIGGGVAVVGRIIDDYTGKQIIQFSGPMSGMGQFYRQNRTALPTFTGTDLVDLRGAPYQSALMAPAPGTGVVGGPAPTAVHTAGSAAAAKKAGVGWAQLRRRTA